MHNLIKDIDQSTLPISLKSLKALLDMVLAAGRAAVDMRAQVDISTKSGPEDLVTCADKKLSEILMAGLGREFPDYQIISEESPFEASTSGARRWFIDPIDGTKHYVQETGRWSVMLGLVDGNNPIFGIVYIPAKHVMYFGGPECGTWKMKDGAEAVKVSVESMNEERLVRTLISKNDLASNLWANNIAGIDIESASSIGLDVHEVIQGSVDCFVHIRPSLKAWDTAAPAAIALGAGLEIGTESVHGFTYPFDSVSHDYNTVFGRKGTVGWWQRGHARCQSNAINPVRTLVATGC